MYLVMFCLFWQTLFSSLLLLSCDHQRPVRHYGVGAAAGAARAGRGGRGELHALPQRVPDHLRKRGRAGFVPGVLGVQLHVVAVEHHLLRGGGTLHFNLAIQSPSSRVGHTLIRPSFGIALPNTSICLGGTLLFYLRARTQRSVRRVRVRRG